MRALLVHSPLVGPATVRPLGAELVARGWTVSTPDLRAGIHSPTAFADLARSACQQADVVVAHSGAGVVLPVIAAALDASMVFVDAVVPEPRDTHEPSVGFLDLIDGLAVDDGLLPPWPDWWPPGTMERLVADPDLRLAITAEVPRVPRSFYDHTTELPAQWWSIRGAYLQLSPGYDDDRSRAESFGWPVARFEGQHLDLAARPGPIADLVLDLTE